MSDVGSLLLRGLADEDLLLLLLRDELRRRRRDARARRRRGDGTHSAHHAAPPFRVEITGRLLLRWSRALATACAGATAASAAALLLQLAWTAARTPRLPPPPGSGEDFPRAGRVVRLSRGGTLEDADDGGGDAKGETTDREFRLAVIGDSPVEGVGCATHGESLGGRTAMAFAELLCVRAGTHDSVRYHSLGRRGLTARGIEGRMLPLLRSRALRGREVDAVLILCGVNNVLDPASTAASFGDEVRSLLRSVRSGPGLSGAAVLVLSLPDFARMPFLPWPLNLALGWRARRMQRALERAVEDSSAETSATTAMVRLPEVSDLLGTGGYYEYAFDEDAVGGRRLLTTRTLRHPLLRYVGDIVDPSGLSSLGVKDFFCRDGFHPGGLGNVLIGRLVAEAFQKMVGLQT